MSFADTVDPIVVTMLTLRNKWSLTDELSTGSIIFGTRFYDKSIIFPQIVVVPLGGSETPPLSIGSSNAYYKNQPTIGINIYVRPNQDSNKSLGWAKYAVYELRKETERILRSGSRLDYVGQDRNLFLTRWDRKDDLSVHPPLFQLFGKCIVVKYEKGV